MTASDGFKAAGKIVTGTKQTIKAVELGKAAEAIVAQDADPRMVARIVQLCEQMNVKLTQVDTMRTLGKMCGIEVDAAMAAILEE